MHAAAASAKAFAYIMNSEIEYERKRGKTLTFTAFSIHSSNPLIPIKLETRGFLLHRMQLQLALRAALSCPVSKAGAMPFICHRQQAWPFESP
jgi:hypothetical protein